MEDSGGEFLGTLFARPPVASRALLRKHGLVGWDAWIAVLDSGISGEITPIEAQDFVGTGIVDTTPQKHGTSVARIIKHYAPGAQLYVAKIGNERPMEGALLKALEWAADRRANIINISSGFRRKGCRGQCDLGELIDRIAEETSIVIVVAAGNGGPKEDTITCPGCAKNALTVGAIDPHGNLAHYSGRGVPGWLKPNLLAPGEVVINDVPCYGTSYAAPIVSGILAATLIRFSSGLEAAHALQSTARLLGLPRHYEGFGVINLEAYLEVALKRDRADSADKRHG
ncbi:MAG: S8 family peptidase [Moorellales bacterium]